MYANEGVAVAKTASGAIRVVIGDRRRLIAEALAALIETLEGFTVTGVVGATKSFRRSPPPKRQTWPSSVSARTRTEWSSSSRRSPRAHLT